LTIKPSRWTVRAALLVVLVLAGSGGNLLWTSHAIRAGQAQSQRATQVAIAAAIAINDRAWCDSLNLLVSGPAPATQAGKKLFANFQTLRHRFGCDK